MLSTLPPTIPSWASSERQATGNSYERPNREEATRQWKPKTM